MFRNYYKIALRHIQRSRFHACINIIGLSTGIAITLLIGAYCWGEWRVNRELSNASRQYILTDDWKDPNMGYPVTAPGQLALELKKNYPSLVANFYRFDGITTTISSGDKHFREGVQIGDSTLLPMYGFALLYGDERTALDHPFSLVLTEEKARKYFGRADVVGQDLTIENFSGGKQDFRITGVMKTPTRNSVTGLVDAYQNHFFVPASNLAFFNRNMNWANTAIGSYVELQKGIRPQALTGAIDHLMKQNVSSTLYDKVTVRVQALPEFYLKGNGGAAEKMLYTLSFVAFFILLMAIINFINLSVSQSAARMREIGIRKVLGSLRRQLISQFLTESVLMALLATGVSLVLYLSFSPLVAGMLGKSIPSLWQLPAISWLIIFLFAVFTGVLAGIYPALLLSSLGSVEVLKGRLATVDGRRWLRKGLLGIQFATAAVVLIAATIVSQQIDLFFSDRLGYDKEYIVAAQVPRDWSLKGVQHLQTVRTEFTHTPGIKEVTLSYEIPNGMSGGSAGIWPEGGDSTHAVVTDAFVADEHYAATYHIPMAAGVFFHGAAETSVQDSLRVVINETTVRRLGWSSPQEAIGKHIQSFGRGRLLTVSGVVKDFHFDAMQEAIKPAIFVSVWNATVYRYFSFKLKPGNMAEAIRGLERQWAILLPGAAFDYKFMDEYLQAIYTNELRLKKAATSATFLALVIVLLGVVGLVSLSVQRRLKEIAIRRVIGASVPGIVQLFLREYLPVLGISTVAATPLAYWIMQRWLEGYATRITVTAWPFVSAILGLGVAMGVLIVTQTIKAALANPVKSLKAE